MKRHAIKRWIGTCLLSSALAAGCSQTGQRPAMRGPAMAAAPVQPAAPLAAAHLVMPPVSVPVMPAPPPQPVVIKQPAVTELPPVAQAVHRPAEPQRSVAKPEPPRKSFVDITAHPCFAHAEDYSWLCGQVQFSPLKGWRLRYASVDENDRYGGSVTLVDDGNLQGLKDGQYVKIEGQLVDPDLRIPAPPYRVRSIQPVQANP